MTSPVVPERVGPDTIAPDRDDRVPTDENRGGSVSPRAKRPPLWQTVLVVAVGVAAVAFVVMLAGGVLLDGAGTGRPADFYSALGRELTDPVNWRVVGMSAVAGALVTAVAGGIVALRRRR